MASLINKQIPHYGGQALIEGVLMRGQNHVVAAVRDSKGVIHIKQEKLTGIYQSKISKIPFLRGLIILWDSLILGMKYLTISANFQTEDEGKIEGPVLYLTLIVSLTFSIGLFFVLPSLIMEWISNYWTLNTLLINLIEGLLRLSILIMYICIIGFSKEISRVFSYHGAEHKTINAYENGMDINAEQVKKFPLAHPRCGTSFLLTLIVLSVIIFSFLGELSLGMRIFTRILFLPIIAMIAYELIRWLGDHENNLFVKIILYPNLLLQKLTTREPTMDMIEVAINSFNKLLELENI